MMNSSKNKIEQSKYANDFKQNIHSKIIQKALQTILIILTIYIAMKLCECHQQIIDRQFIEQQYLSDIGRQQLYFQNFHIESIIAFLDFTHQLFLIPNICPTFFFCDALFNLIQIHLQTIAHCDVKFVFQYYNSQIIFPYRKVQNNFVKYNLLQNDPNYSILVSNLSYSLQFASNTQYYYTQYDSFDIICIPIQSISTFFCVSYHTYLIKLSPNPFIRLPSYTFSSFQQRVSQGKSALTNLPIYNTSQTSSSILQQITILTSYSNVSSTILYIPGTLLQTSLLFSYDSASLPTQVPFYFTNVSPLSVNITILSTVNTTYLNDVEQILYATINDIEYTVKVILGAILLFFIWSSTPEVIIVNTLYGSIEQVKKLTDLIKNRDIMEFQQLTASAENTIMGFLVQYFKLFVWALKLHQAQQTNKYKKLLLEGIPHLDQNNFAPILKFIYSEIIYLEKIKIAQIKKINCIILRKNSHTHKHSEKDIKKNTIKNIKGKKLTRKITIDNKVDQENEISQFNLKNQQKLQKQQKQYVQLSIKHNKKGQRTSALKNKEYKKQQKKIKNATDDDLLMKNICGVRFSTDIKTNEVEPNILIRKIIKQKKVEGDEFEFQASNRFSSLHSYPSFEAITSRRQIKTMYSTDNNLHEQLDQYKFDGQKEIEEEAFEDILVIYSRVLDYYDKLINIVEAEELITDTLSLKLGKMQVVQEKISHERRMHPQQEMKQQLYIQSIDTHLIESSSELYQAIELIKMKLNRLSSIPFSCKCLEQLCHSQSPTVRRNARKMYAEECTKVYPHLQIQILHKCVSTLLEEQTTHEFKREMLEILIRTLELKKQFKQQVLQLSLLRQHYNYNNKKYYFIVGGDYLANTLGFFNKIHSCLTRYDLIQIWNMSDEDIKTTPQTSKPESPEELLNLFEPEKRSSVKSISKRSEALFSKVLSCIEDEQIQFSKYVIIVLGGESQNHSGQNEDSSSYTNRAIQQKMHQEITRQMSKSYFHIVLAAEATVHPHSKHARIKRYARLCPTLLEVDLKNMHLSQNIYKLQQFLQ